MIYIATFFAHIGAVKFKKACDEIKIPARVMPVPRALSSSCGVCVRFEYDGTDVKKLINPDMEKLVKNDAPGYEEIYRAEGI